MNSTAFLLAAALTPRDQWHERWKHVNRLAGIVAERAQWVPGLGLADELQEADEIVSVAADYFARFLRGQEEAGINVAAIRAQERELIEGLARRVAECLTIGQCEGINDVTAVLDAIRRTKGQA